MKIKDIIWNENGWTTIQDANGEKHLLEISCLAKDGTVVEIRRRHTRGEEEKLTGVLDENYSLPMTIDELKIALTKGHLTLK